MEITTIVAGVFIFTGCFFFFVAAIGMVRFPDFYSRLHPAGKCDTMGLSMVLVGLMIFEGFSLVSLKLLIISAFVFIANPTATHALANAALSVGLKPWEKGDVKEDEGGPINDH